MGVIAGSPVQLWAKRIGQLAWHYRLTVLLTLPAFIVCLLPGAAKALQFDRLQLVGGQWYRFITCHWTHWNADHAFWDILMCGVLAAFWERRSRRALLLTTGTSVIAISTGLWLCAPQFATYRGLSGLDSAFFALAGTSLLFSAWRDGQWTCFLGGLLLAGGFFGKTCFEVVTGASFFVDSRSAGFVPVPLAHAIGATIGAAIAAGASIQPPKAGKSVRRYWIR